MITAKSVCIAGSPLRYDPLDAVKRLLLSIATANQTTSRTDTPCGEGFGYEGIHAGEVGTDVLSAIHHKRGISAKPTEQRSKESFHGGSVHEPHRDTRAETLGELTGPVGEQMELSREVVRQAAIELFSVHLLPQPGDLPGHLAMLSVLVVGGDIGDDFHTNRSASGIRCHGSFALHGLTRTLRILYRLPSTCNSANDLVSRMRENSQAAHRSLSGPSPIMRDEDWLGKDSAALEQLLVERWLYRGGMLGVMFLSAILTTYLGIRGISTLADTLAVGACLALAVAAAAVAFVMRLRDMRIHRELRRRKERPR
jgi:hypothetical protein